MKFHFFVVLLFFTTAVCFADDSLSLSGGLDLQGMTALDGNSVKEDPGFTARVKIDTPPLKWRLHLELEGGWDGGVQKPVKDHALLKTWDKVYQSNTPWLEFKELYAAYVDNNLEMRLGIQRFAWGRLDEYPVNDLLNTWDYTRFILKPLEERKIGVPSFSASSGRGDWNYELVWIPMLVPYRLPMPNERWSGVPGMSALTGITDAEIVPAEADLPPRTIGNSEVALRVRHAGDVEWAVNLFHGYDPRPVFKTTALVIAPQSRKIFVDPGYQPDFHKMTSIGLDAATVVGEWSLRGEAAYGFGRRFNTRAELWGYPAVPGAGVSPLAPNQVKNDTFDYGIGVDYRLFEDCMLTMQAQQTVIFNRPDTLYERQFETLLWANIKAGWMNRKVETNLNIAWNPEHGDIMTRLHAWYIFSDSWKGGVNVALFSGPPQSLFGRFSANDQVEVKIVYAW